MPKSADANIGKVYLQQSKDRWQMSEHESPATGAEFETFTRELDSFLSGYYLALGLDEPPAYVRGDFFWERTDGVYFSDRTKLSSAFIRAVQKWLFAERRSNWRVIIPGKKHDDNLIVIYSDSIALSPKVRSLVTAITET